MTLVLGGNHWNHKEEMMGPKYFDGLSWNNITREERAFCAELFFCIREHPESFVRFLFDETCLPSVLPGPWDTAYEVCFYRDFLHGSAPKQKQEFSPKRTFDIALFSDEAIIIIEAKAAQLFTTHQATSFSKDLKDIPCLLKRSIPIYLIALGSRTYFENYKQAGRSKALAPFKNRHLTWEAVNRRYSNVPLFERACEVYERLLLEA
jgi:hypothetical protein